MKQQLDRAVTARIVLWPVVRRQWVQKTQQLKMNIGDKIIGEIVKQGMFRVSFPDPDESHVFVWSSGATEQLDPTLRRIRGFSRGWGFTSFVMTNLFAFRATDPNDMMREGDPVGPETTVGSSRRRGSVRTWLSPGVTEENTTCARRK